MLLSIHCQVFEQKPVGVQLLDLWRVLQDKRIRPHMNRHRAISRPAAGSDFPTGNPGEVIA